MYRWLLQRKQYTTFTASRRLLLSFATPHGWGWLTADRHIPILSPQPCSGRAGKDALSHPQLFQPLAKPSQALRCPGVSARWSCGSQRASLLRQASPRHPPWPLGDSWQRWLTGREPCKGPGTCLHWNTAYSLLPLPSSPFLPPFPRGPNSRLCCSINIITIIILSLDT